MVVYPGKILNFDKSHIKNAIPIGLEIASFDFIVEPSLFPTAGFHFKR